MLDVTQQLIATYRQSNAEYYLQQAMINTVIQLGSLDDAESLLSLYLEDIFDIDRQLLLPVFYKFGDSHFAEIIYQKLLSYADYEHHLNETWADVLQGLGHFQYEPIKDFLAKIVFTENYRHDYYLHKSATLALLNFNCAEYLPQIEQGLNQYKNQNLFPEFFPALVSKLPNTNDYLPMLFEWGEKYASKDCIAGIILAFSLCGEQGKDYFLRAIVSPSWEATLSGTGTGAHTYQGLNNLNISLADLFKYINSNNVNDKSYAMEVFFDIADNTFYDVDSTEDFVDLFRILFGEWAFENCAISRLASEEQQSQVDWLQKQLRLKMQQQLFLQNYSPSQFTQN